MGLSLFHDDENYSAQEYNLHFARLVSGCAAFFLGVWIAVRLIASDFAELSQALIFLGPLFAYLFVFATLFIPRIQNAAAMLFNGGLAAWTVFLMIDGRFFGPLWKALQDTLFFTF